MAKTRAQKPGTCGECRRQIKPGDTIEKVDNRWVHDQCTPERVKIHRIITRVVRTPRGGK